MISYTKIIFYYEYIIQVIRVYSEIVEEVLPHNIFGKRP